MRLSGGAVAIHTLDRWCAALYKRTERYQDNVKLLCGFVAVAPLDIRYNGPVTCKLCITKLRRRYADEQQSRSDSTPPRS